MCHYPGWLERVPVLPKSFQILCGSWKALPNLKVAQGQQLVNVKTSKTTCIQETSFASTEIWADLSISHKSESVGDKWDFFVNHFILNYLGMHQYENVAITIWFYFAIRADNWHLTISYIFYYPTDTLRKKKNNHNSDFTTASVLQLNFPCSPGLCHYHMTKQIPHPIQKQTATSWQYISVVIISSVLFLRPVQICQIK